MIGIGGGTAAMLQFVRHFSRKRGRNLKKIDPKVPKEEAVAISEELYRIIKEHGPLTVSSTWNYAKEAGVSGLNSKTHMKLLLKWMRGREMLKLFCTQTGSSKKFLHSTLPEVPPTGKIIPLAK
ncbi:tumor necrosis factor receptor family protein [Wolffia australiana]